MDSRRLFPASAVSLLMERSKSQQVARWLGKGIPGR